MILLASASDTANVVRIIIANNVIGALPQMTVVTRIRAHTLRSECGAAPSAAQLYWYETSRVFRARSQDAMPCHMAVPWRRFRASPL